MWQLESAIQKGDCAEGHDHQQTSDHIHKSHVIRNILLYTGAVSVPSPLTFKTNIERSLFILQCYFCV